MRFRSILISSFTSYGCIVSLVVYLEPRTGDFPGHMVVGDESSSGRAAFFGYRYDPLDLPVSLESLQQIHSYFKSGTCPGSIVDESSYVEFFLTHRPTDILMKRAQQHGSVYQHVPPRHLWLGFAEYSFHPDTFHSSETPCYNCVTWVAEIANRVLNGFLAPVPQGRVSEMKKQLIPFARLQNPGETVE
jgi:hypothetical protein